MTNLQLLRKLAQEWGPTDSTGKVTAWAAEEIKRLDADAAGVQAELASVKACWAEALENYANIRREKDAEIERLRKNETAEAMATSKFVELVSAERDRLRAAIRLILPLAKGYSPPGQSDSARKTCLSWIEAAEEALGPPSEPCAQLSHKQLELKAVEALRRACSTLTDDAVLPATMTFPLGEVGAYGFELRVAMKSAAEPPGPARQSPADLVGALQDRVHEDTGAVRAGHAVKSNPARNADTRDYNELRNVLDQRILELARYKRALYAANGFLIQHGLEAVKLDYSTGCTTKGDQP